MLSVISVAFLFLRVRCTVWFCVGFAMGPATWPFGDRALERFDFFFFERPDGAGWQIAEAHRADSNAFEALHFVADAGQQAADLAVASFVEDHFEDRRLFFPTLDAHMFYVRETFGQMDSFVELS